MKGDFSRNSFDPTKHYSSVRMQQGRVQMDADWNEQIDIIDHQNRLFTEDFLGNTIGPSIGAGFAIGVTPEQQDLSIGLGRYYVDGLLVENNSSLYFTNQVDYPQAVLPNPDGVYLTYLEVWQQSLSVADNADMAESALGGADTATRLRNRAQVKLLPIAHSGISTLTYAALFDFNAAPETSAYNNLQQWNALTNRLPSDVNAVRLLPDVGTITSNTTTTYHIQIHQGGHAEQATYKTSNETPLVQVAVSAINVIDANTNKITLAKQPDGQTAFATQQWLELTIPTRVAARIPGDLVVITDADDVVLEVSGVIGSDIISSLAGVATATRWQQNAIAVTHSTDYPLEAELAINFLGNTFETGSYWIIALADNTVNWPSDNGQLRALPPNSTTIGQLKPSLSSPTLQNQLYRVEIHQSTSDDHIASFKWSRDNASVSSSLSMISGNNITLATLPQDGISNFVPSQWLELTTPTRELIGIPGDMVQIITVNGAILSVSGAIGTDIIVANNAIARRWDTAVNGSAPAVNTIVVNTVFPLENGLSISFFGSDFQMGDYWLIPTRAALNSQGSSIEWPADANGNFLITQPQGIERSYAPLAIVQCSNGLWNFQSDARTIAIAQNEYVSINALQQGTYVTAVDVGAVNAIILNPGTAYSPYIFGTQIEFLAQYTNTGPTTVTINSNASANLVIQTPSGLLSTVGGEVVAGNIYRILFDGTQWQLMNPTVQKQQDQYVSISALQQGAYVTAIDVGSVNAIVLNPGNAYLPYIFGTQIEFLAQHTNTGATTVTINSNVTANPYLVVQTPLGPLSPSGGEIVAGNIYRIFFDGSQWQLMNPSKQRSFLCTATQMASQVINSSAVTIIQFDTAISDNLTWFTASNHSIKPNISGFFDLFFAINIVIESPGFVKIYYMKNGAPGSLIAQESFSPGVTSIETVLNGSQPVYLNGTTDYLQLSIALETPITNALAGGALSSFNLIYRGN